MFHRLVENANDQLLQDICFPERGLRDLVLTCRRRGVDIVSVDEALRRLIDPEAPPFVVLTFDDGYRDNLIRVRATLTPLRAPFAVFVCTGMIQRSIDYWWGPLVKLFKTADVVDIAPMDRRFLLRTWRERARALHEVTRWVETDVAARAGTLAPIFARHGVEPRALLEQDAMTADELRTLSADPAVEIGGHGVTHRPLASLSEREATSELVDSRTYLEHVCDREVAHFAYPHGDDKSCGWRDARLARASGYRTAFTTRRGNLFTAHAEKPFLLPRGAMNPRRAAPFHAEAQLAGVHRLLESGGGAPIHPDTLPYGA